MTEDNRTAYQVQMDEKYEALENRLQVLEEKHEELKDILDDIKEVLRSAGRELETLPY